jgi:hypothetical protein
MEASTCSLQLCKCKEAVIYKARFLLTVTARKKEKNVKKRYNF